MGEVVSKHTRRHREKQQSLNNENGAPSMESVADKWKKLAAEIVACDQSTLSQSGSLVVLGSGIMAVGHFTLETLGHIQDADRVFYLVAEPATEAYIQKLKPDALDLFVLYGEGKNRHTTYSQITKVLLHYARRGEKVVAIFYGHPGYLVNPSNDAISIARSEGIQAIQLPAISSLDTMIAELGFEPVMPGLQVLEATDLLIYSRQFMTDCHVVINQAGSVGDVSFHHKGFPNSHLPILIKYLQESYGEDHVVYNYIGSQFAVCKSVIERYKLSDLLKPECAANIQVMSTLYVPPKEKGTLNKEMVEKLGMARVTKEQAPDQTVNDNDSTTTEESAQKQEQQNDKEDGKKDARTPLEKWEQDVVAIFSSWTIPKNYEPTQPTPLAEFIEDVSTNPQMLNAFLTEGAPSGLPEYQAKALTTRNSGWIRFSLKCEAYEVKKQLGQQATDEEKPASVEPIVAVGAASVEPIVTVGAASVEPIVAVGAASVEPIVAVGAASVEPIVAVGAASVEPIVAVGAASVEPIVAVGAASVEPIVAVGAASVEPIVAVGAASVEPIVAVGAASVEPIVAVGAASVEPIVAVGAASVEPIVAVGAASVEPIVAVGAASAEPVVAVGAVAVEELLIVDGKE